MLLIFLNIPKFSKYRNTFLDLGNFWISQKYAAVCGRPPRDSKKFQQVFKGNSEHSHRNISMFMVNI